MAWPPSDIGAGNTDAGTDSPQVARTDLLGLIQAFNLLRNHFSTFMRGLAEAVDPPAARTALGASTVGSNLFTAADAAAARTALGASTVGGNVFTAADQVAARASIGAVGTVGVQTVADLKTFSGGHLSTSPSQPIGYGTGSGATVTQTTNKATAVTINTPSGYIITHNAALAGGASVEFSVNNNTVDVNACAVIAHPRIDGNYIVSVTNAHSGVFRLRLTNLTGVSLSNAVQITFMVIRGVGS
jgi:hypothetical protein